MRAYVGQGLRQDLERLESEEKISPFIDSLRKLGIGDEVIASAVAEVETEGP